MNLEERLKNEIGSLVIQLHQKAAQIDEMAQKISALMKQVEELTSALEAAKPQAK
jgi:DNA anti-recombination protein RmuC